MKVDVPDVRAELQFLNQLNHPNCMRLLAFEIDITLTVTMLIEFCPYSLEDLRIAKDDSEKTRTRLDLKFARHGARFWGFGCHSKILLDDPTLAAVEVWSCVASSV
jgi:hypothetical protein